MAGAFVGRQAIYDRSLNVHGYELLYRSGSDAQTATHTCGEQATAQVIWDAFHEIGAERIAGDVPCFVNLTKAYITGELPLPLPANRVVIEVLEDVMPTPDVIAGLQRLHDEGVKIALDDYVHRAGNEAMLELADYVKIDLRAQGPEETRELCEMLRHWNVKLLAEKVETKEEMRFCQELGFEYFQGYFLTRPEVIEGKRVPANKLGMMQILSKLHDPDVDVEELQVLIGQDVSLVYKLLRHVNSALYAPQHAIEDIQHTLVMLGLEMVRKIVSLIVLMDLGDGQGDLVSQSLVRARMCQSLAQLSGKPHEHSYFTVGLLSTLDALIGMPMDQVLKELPLTEELVTALLCDAGSMGEALHCVRAYEVGDWSNVHFAELSADELRDAFVSAVSYSREILGGMPGGRRAA